MKSGLLSFRGLAGAVLFSCEALQQPVLGHSGLPVFRREAFSRTLKGAPRGH